MNELQFFAILTVLFLFYLSTIPTRQSKRSLETELEQDSCPHKHTGYERGFGARPYRRCFKCDAIVEDE